MSGDDLQAEYGRAVERWHCALAEEATYSARIDVLRLQLADEDAARAPLWISVLAATCMLLLALALPARAEPATLTAAQAAQAACVAREYRTRTASAGVSATEAGLVARAQAEHVCGVEARVRLAGAAAELVIRTATRAPTVCEPNPPAPLESCADRPTWIDVLSHGGACALCGGGVALGAWAACGGAR